MDLNIGDTRDIIKYCESKNIMVEHAAYILATAYWETNRTIKPVQEAYWLSEGWRKRNLRYYPWHGRGYVQITWRRNYVYAGKRLNLDLITDPTVVMEKEVAIPILVRGSMEGWFTGKSLVDYIKPGSVDYVNARRVINGRDKARAIASLAVKYELALRKDRYGRRKGFRKWGIRK